MALCFRMALLGAGGAKTSNNETVKVQLNSINRVCLMERMSEPCWPGCVKSLDRAFSVLMGSLATDQDGPPKKK